MAHYAQQLASAADGSPPRSFQQPILANLQRCTEQANDVLTAVLRAAKQNTTSQYRDFLLRPLEGSAAGGHALPKMYEKDVGKSYEAMEQARQQVQGTSVEERMITRINTWGVRRWQVHSHRFTKDLAEAWDLLGKACQAEDIETPKFALRHLRNILKSWPAKAGLGLDMWVIRLWATLPDEGLQMLLSIIYLVLEGCVPMQLLMVLIGLLPKPLGGERPIALTPMLYRVIMKLCKGYVTEWDEQAAGFWDTAIRGNSCLRAAVATALKMELSDLQGYANIGLLWDLEAFYDSIRIHRLIGLALERDFSPMVLNLTMKVHCAGRAFKEGPYMSHFIQPNGLSILAGCGTSISLTRATLYNVLAEMHASYRPCQLQTYVDDCPQTPSGPEETIAEDAVEQGIHFVRLLEAEGLRVSPKSTSVASSPTLAKRCRRDWPKRE